jgi:DNA-binding GntR family transcriptional regulator
MKERPEIADGAQPSLQGEGAYCHLLNEIRTGDLAPGARLTEIELAERLAISRTPVREAIRRLEADGLVAHEPRVGARIRSLDYAEVMELYEMRNVLEGTAARMAARSASEVEIAELAATNDEMAAVPDDPPRLAALNRRFHLTLIDAARNRYLVKAVQSVHKTMLILGPTTLEAAERARTAVVEHAEVLAALTARDGAAAESAMRRHMEAAQRARLRQLRARDGWDRREREW